MCQPVARLRVPFLERLEREEHDAAFGVLTKPLMDRPGNCTACSTPGCFSAMSAICRTTASVRSSEAASGNWANATRYCLSCVGTKPVGTLRESDDGQARARPA